MVDTEQQHPEPHHGSDIYTVANIITVLRLMLVPVFFEVLVSGKDDVVAFAIFALAASTDWLDGQIARRTGTVTEIGKAIDPLVDRLLIASGVLGVYLAGRLPLWTVLLLMLRDVYLLGGSAYLARHRAERVPVIYIGKVTTATLLVGFAGLILDWPRVSGLGVLDSRLLPGFGGAQVALWTWFVYGGVVLSMVTAVVYTSRARASLARARVTKA